MCSIYKCLYNTSIWIRYVHFFTYMLNLLHWLFFKTVFGWFKQMCCNSIKTLFIGMDWQGSGEGAERWSGDQWASESPAGTTDYHFAYLLSFLPGPSVQVSARFGFRGIWSSSHTKLMWTLAALEHFWYFCTKPNEFGMKQHKRKVIKGTYGNHFLFWK